MWFARRYDTSLVASEAPPASRAVARSPAARFAGRARDAARCRRGATLLEFGFITPALLALLLGAVEMGFQAAISVALENAALQASRTGSLGRENTDGTRAGVATQACVLKAARAAGGGLLNGDLQLTMTNYGTAAAAGADPNQDNGTGTSGAGAGSRTVVYELTYTQPFAFMGRLYGRNLVHNTVITVQNEPFSDASKTATAKSC